VGFQPIQSSYALLNFSDQIVKVVSLDTGIAVAGFWVGATTVADNLIAGIALQPISWRGLDDSNEKCTVIKLTIGDSQIAFKFGFFADRTDFWHGISFLKVKGQRQAAPYRMDGWQDLQTGPAGDTPIYRD